MVKIKLIFIQINGKNLYGIQSEIRMNVIHGFSSIQFFMDVYVCGWHHSESFWTRRRCTTVPNFFSFCFQTVIFHTIWCVNVFHLIIVFYLTHINVYIFPHFQLSIAIRKKYLLFQKHLFGLW